MCFSYFSVTKSSKRYFVFLALFTDEKRGKSHIRGLSTLLYISPCRLAATSANKVRRPSHYSLTTATGSKRSSADSDSLLCHVRLWRTSRFGFGCVSGREHGMIEFALAIYYDNTSSVAVNRATFSHWRRLAKILAFVSAHIRPTPALHLYAGVQAMRARICSALSCDMFARVV